MEYPAPRPTPYDIDQFFKFFLVLVLFLVFIVRQFNYCKRCGEYQPF